MLRWILPFGLRREQPKTRRSMDTVKPNLEELTQRILLSASGTTSPQMTAQMTAMMDQTFQLFETVEQNLVNIFDTYTQRIAQDVASNVQQWQQLLGLTPPASGSGSGSGSGTITTTHNNSNQTPIAIRPQSGSGSGSGAMTSHENPSKSGGKSMMGSGSCGSGSGPIPQVYFGSGSNPFYETSGSCMVPEYATRTVLLSGPTCHNVTVNYYTKDDTALAGTDYIGVGSGSGIGTVTIPAGQVTSPQPIKIQILDDGVDEDSGTQDFFVVLTNPKGATLGNNKTEVEIAEAPQQQPTDTLRWNPCTDNNASTVTNWYDVTRAFQLQKGAPGPGPGTPIEFDDYVEDFPISDEPIIWDKSFTVASISLIQYTGKQTIPANIKVESNGASGTSLSMDGSSDLKLAFGGSNSYFQVDNNATITNMDITGGYTATLLIHGGTTTIAESAIAGSANYEENLGVDLYIDPGATLDHQGKTTLTLTDKNLTIKVFGKMNVNSSSAGMALIDSGANNNSDSIQIIGGTLTYSGSAGATDTFNVPVWVTSAGSFIVSGGNESHIGTENLIVKGTLLINQKSVYMDGTGSSLQLSEYAGLEADNDYQQDNGTLETMDPTDCDLRDGAGAGGIATINGGSLLIAQNTYPGQFGTLSMLCGTLNFAGKYGPTINGEADGQCDVLDAIGSIVNIKNTADLTIDVYGTLEAKNVWTIIKAGNKLQPFNPNNTNEKQLGLTETVTNLYEINS